MLELLYLYKFTRSREYLSSVLLQCGWFIGSLGELALSDVFVAVHSRVASFPGKLGAVGWYLYSFFSFILS